MKVHTNVQAFFGEFDISCEGNRFDPNGDIRNVERTAWCDDAVRREPGLEDFQGSFGGTMRYEDPGTALFNSRGSFIPFSVCPERRPAQEGDLCMFVKALSAQFSAPVRQGELAEFDASIAGDGALLLGKVLAEGTKSSAANGGAVVMPAVPADTTVYAVLHAPTVATSLDVTIESDDAGGFPSPTTRFTFDQLTAPGYQFMELGSGAGLTDTQWRATWSPVGGDAVVLVALAIARNI